VIVIVLSVWIIVIVVIVVSVWIVVVGALVIVVNSNDTYTIP
jgi:hypothetical protein